MKNTLLTLTLCIATLFSLAQTPPVVISTLFTGGNTGSGTAYRHDFVELKNRTNANVDLTGYSLQYGTSIGNFAYVYAFPSGTTIPAYGYFTVKLGPTNGAGVDFAADQTLTTFQNMSFSSGKVALVNGQSPLDCGATAAPCAPANSFIVDLVAYGNANSGEGGTTTSGGTALTGYQASTRINVGCTDNNNNATDFTITDYMGVSNPPAPRTAASGTTVACTTLPVTITSLSGKREEGFVALNWAVGTEESINAYVVERTSPGSNNWSAIGAVTASGASAYRFLDRTPLSGTGLYRLQVVDRSGGRNYTAVVPVHASDGALALALSPNPAKGHALLRTNSVGIQSAVVHILDAGGRVMRGQKGIASASKPLRLDLAGLRQGQYFVQVQTGGTTETQKLMISE